MIDMRPAARAPLKRGGQRPVFAGLSETFRMAYRTILAQVNDSRLKALSNWPKGRGAELAKG
jgi:hypothetical protein